MPRKKPTTVEKKRQLTMHRVHYLETRLKRQRERNNEKQKIIVNLKCMLWTARTDRNEYKRRLKESEARYNKFLLNYRAVARFFTRPFYWRLGGGQNTLATEIVERIVSGYEKLRRSYKLNQMAVTIFSTGYNQESFTSVDIAVKRHTEDKLAYTRVVLEKMETAGYLAEIKMTVPKIYAGKNTRYYYLTPKGRERWELIIKTIFLTQVKRPWRDIIDTVVPFEEKRTVRTYTKGKLKT